MRKAVHFIVVQSNRNSASWRQIKRCHLLTGPNERAPDGWYDKAAASIPDSLFPDSLLDNLEAGLAEYEAALAAIQRRRADMLCELFMVIVCSEL